jgi:hypothetical protein
MATAWQPCALARVMSWLIAARSRPSLAVEQALSKEIGIVCG